MAIKDWKIYDKDNTGQVGWIIWNNKKYTDDFVELSKDNKSWWVSDYNRGSPVENKKRFKSKSQAMGFARQYMRTH